MSVRNLKPTTPGQRQKSISNFDDNLKIGDIVGIKLETKKRFNKTSVIKSIVKKEFLKHYKDINIITDEHEYREDHLFKIKSFFVTYRTTIVSSSLSIL